MTPDLVLTLLVGRNVDKKIIIKKIKNGEKNLESDVRPSVRGRETVRTDPIQRKRLKAPFCLLRE